MSRKKIHEKSPNLSGQKLSLLVGKTFAKKISLACLEQKTYQFKQNQYLKCHKHSELKILKSATNCLSIMNKYNKSEMYGLETLDAQWAKLGKKYTIEGN